MQKSKPPSRNLKRHPSVQRDAIDDIRDAGPSSDVNRNGVAYSNPNRDRAVGSADRTGRHFDELHQSESAETGPAEEAGEEADKE